MPELHVLADLEVRRGATPRRRGRGLLAVVLAIGLGAGLFQAGRDLGRQARTVEPLSSKIDGVLAAAGLGIGEVTLLGHKFTTDTEIYGALGLDRAGSLLTYDVGAARGRIESLPWVRKAEVSRIFPDRLHVLIEERVPVAVWEHRGKTTLVDRQGRVLAYLSGPGRVDLPRIAGDGAPAAVASLLAALAPYREIAAKLEVAHRIGERRWTLNLADATRILLPAAGEGEALLRLTRHAETDGLLATPGEVIDLRRNDVIAVGGGGGQSAEARAGRHPPL